MLSTSSVNVSRWIFSSTFSRTTCEDLWEQSRISFSECGASAAGPLLRVAFFVWQSSTSNFKKRGINKKIQLHRVGLYFKIT